MSAEIHYVTLVSGLPLSPTKSPKIHTATPEPRTDKRDGPVETPEPCLYQIFGFSLHFFFSFS